MSRTRALVLVAGITAAVLVLLVVPFTLRRSSLDMMSTWIVMTIGAMGLNLTLGYAGQISLAQGAFVGVGAYVTAIMTVAGLPFYLAIPASGLICFGAGWLLGYPALRVQHHYLAFVTLAFSTLAYLVFRNEVWLTKGIAGITDVPRPKVFGASLQSNLPFYFFCLGVLALVSIAFYLLVRSPWGRAFLALRENPVRALSLGIDTRRYTLMAFAIGSALGGISGSLYAPLVGFVDPSPFTLSLSLNLLLMVIVGGSGLFFGPFLGALVAVLLPEWLRFTEGYYLIIYSVAVFMLLAYSPHGILGIVNRLIEERRTKAASALRAAAGGALSEKVIP